MRSWKIASFALLLGATAARAEVSWQGEAVIDSATSQCTAEESIGPAPQRVLKSVLRPKNLSDNGANTNVVFIANQSAVFAMILDNGAMPAGTAAVFGNDAGGVIKANVGVPYSNFVMVPATVAVNTLHVTLNGTITDFLYVQGCTVNFRAAYTKRND